jgi:Putative prokaryotic signal transducing protein
MALVTLTAAGGYAEAELLKGLLETEGIQCVVQGESRSTDMGTEAGFGEIRILVNEDQLEDAKEVLAARPVSEESPVPGAIAEGAVCPVHEAQAIGICSRCGSHLCEKCGPLGDPPLCESCDERLSQQPRERKATKRVALLMLAFMFGIPSLLAVLISLFFRN